MHSRHILTDAAIFRIKASILQAGRAAHNLMDHAAVRFPAAGNLPDAPVIAESTTDLWTSSSTAEHHLLVGKIHNLRLAIRRLHGAEIPAGKVFSFWGQIGRAGRWKGYVEGRELREGCIIPAIGGGLCQLSNALYDAALTAGFTIVERHAHTRVIPGSLAEIGRDATVFWNYVDLRFTSPYDFRIEAMMDATSLTIRIRGRAPGTTTVLPVPIVLLQAGGTSDPGSCVTCGVERCFRHEHRDDRTAGLERAAFLVDDHWPEFDDHIRAVKRDHDMLFVPLDGGTFGKKNYAWSTVAFHHVRQHRLLTLIRAYRSRRLATQGAARQRALLAFHEKLASAYASGLEHDVTHVVVTQHLLPFLWRDGHLGGRTFDVLMTSLPLAALHDRLDLAASLHPESRTLADFRAEAWLVRAETEALRRARSIITPHSEIAAICRDNAMLIDWSMPARQQPSQPGARLTLAFPAATVGRKGAYELRDALRGLDVHLITTGAQLEHEDFWRGISTVQAGRENWLDGVHAVVLPAFVEHRPRRLLQAVAHGVPVIASAACGLEHVSGVRTIPTVSVPALRAEIERLISAVH